MSDEAREPARKASFWRASNAVFWSFFGVRKHRHYAEDAETLTAAQVIVAGIVGAILFVGVLVSIVYWVVP